MTNFILSLFSDILYTVMSNSLFELFTTLFLFSTGVIVLSKLRKSVV